MTLPAPDGNLAGLFYLGRKAQVLYNLDDRVGFERVEYLNVAAPEIIDVSRDQHKTMHARRRREGSVALVLVLCTEQQGHSAVPTRSIGFGDGSIPGAYFGIPFGVEFPQYFLIQQLDRHVMGDRSIGSSSFSTSHTPDSAMSASIFLGCALATGDPVSDRLGIFGCRFDLCGCQARVIIDDLCDGLSGSLPRSEPAISGGAEITRRFGRFHGDLPALCQEPRIEFHELTFTDNVRIVSKWLLDTESAFSTPP